MSGDIQEESSLTMPNVAKQPGKLEDGNASLGFCIWKLLSVLKRAAWEKHRGRRQISWIRDMSQARPLV